MLDLLGRMLNGRVQPVAEKVFCRNGPLPVALRGEYVSVDCGVVSDLVADHGPFPACKRYITWMEATF